MLEAKDLAPCRKVAKSNKIGIYANKKGMFKAKYSDGRYGFSCLIGTFKTLEGAKNMYNFFVFRHNLPGKLND